MKNIVILEHIYQCTDEAYKRLEVYLSGLRENFKSEPELIRDIELGIIEQLDFILSERVEPCLTNVDIEFLIQKMGDVELLDESMGVDEGMVTSQHLYRDYDNRIFAGVCAGIAAYFNISAWLVRLVLIIAFFTPIPVVIPYLLMWYLLPAAMTKAAKLNMRGVPVNINSLVNYSSYTRNQVLHLAKLILIIVGVAVTGVIALSILISLLLF